jgi:cell division inhibitor SulA
MQTPVHNSQHVSLHPYATTQREKPLTTGLISEFVYDEQQSSVVQLLLPVLHHLSTQSRWLLWLTPQQKLSRHWFFQAGLPVDKIVQINQIHAMPAFNAMEKALQSGNYSVVLGWLPELDNHQRERLYLAAQQGGAYGFIMRPEGILSASRQCSTVKIHNSAYH